MDGVSAEGLKLLQSVARAAMTRRQLEPDFPAAALHQADAITQPAATSGPGVKDLRGRLWCSIDNDDSRDLDQLTLAEPLPNGSVKIYVAVADVDALVARGSPIDLHARTNTTTVYAIAQIFPMLPLKLSTDLSSLGEGVERLAIVVEMTVSATGVVTDSDIYRAVVVNRAKLAYAGVAAWLERRDPAPPRLAAVAGLDAQLRLQDTVAERLRQVRRAHGALTLETTEAQPVFDGGILRDLRPDASNRAQRLIEDFMIAANGVAARYLTSRAIASLRRVLRTPQRWERIVALAREHGEALPAAPSGTALNDFLIRRQGADPAGFADLSLAVIKLLGRGEYVLERPGLKVEGHFGLAVNDYTHATAPNRRFPDLLNQRLLKAALAGASAPYPEAELEGLAAHCTAQEDNAAKVERQLAKSVAALLLSSRVGERFEAFVTGAADKGTWVRISRPTTEGRLIRGFQGLDVGDRVTVVLVHTDVARGFIDFERAHEPASAASPGDRASPAARASP